MEKKGLEASGAMKVKIYKEAYTFTVAALEFSAVLGEKPSLTLTLAGKEVWAFPGYKAKKYKSRSYLKKKMPRPKLSNSCRSQCAGKKTKAKSDAMGKALSALANGKKIAEAIAKAKAVMDVAAPVAQEATDIMEAVMEKEDGDGDGCKKFKTVTTILASPTMSRLLSGLSSLGKTQKGKKKRGKSQLKRVFRSVQVILNPNPTLALTLTLTLTLACTSVK